MKEITDEIETVGKSAGLNCYYEELFHHKQKIGTCGYNGIHIFHPNYTFTEDRNGAEIVLRIYELAPLEPQVPI